MMSEAGGLEKKLERVSDERDRLREELENSKNDRAARIDEMQRSFDKERDMLKQKNDNL